MKKIISLTLLVMVILSVFTLAGCGGPKKIDISKYVNATYDGISGEATVSIGLDSKIDNDYEVDGKEFIMESMGIDSEEEFQYKLMWEGNGKTDFKLSDMLQLDYNLENNENYKNGDKISVEIVPSSLVTSLIGNISLEKLEEGLNIKLDNKTVDITVSGLKECASLPLIENMLTFEYDGYENNIKASIKQNKAVHVENNEGTYSASLEYDGERYCTLTIKNLKDGSVAVNERASLYYSFGNGWANTDINYVSGKIGDTFSAYTEEFGSKYEQYGFKNHISKYNHVITEEEAPKLIKNHNEFKQKAYKKLAAVTQKIAPKVVNGELKTVKIHKVEFGVYKYTDNPSNRCMVIYTFNNNGQVCYGAAMYHNISIKKDGSVIYSSVSHRDSFFGNITDIETIYSWESGFMNKDYDFKVIK